MKANIIGVRESVSKDGNKAFSIAVSIPYTEYEVKSSTSCVGEKVDSYFTRSIDCSVLKPGDRVNLEFEPGFEGKATLVGIHLAK